MYTIINTCMYNYNLDTLIIKTLRSHMPGVTFMRLDGSVPANNRHGLVQR